MRGIIGGGSCTAACSPGFRDGTVFRAPRLPHLHVVPITFTPGHAKRQRPPSVTPDLIRGPVLC